MTVLNFFCVSDEEDDLVKFTLRFLGSVEVRQHKGDDVLRQAISKVLYFREMLE